MEIISASTISTHDLMSFSKDIAQLNLGYLGISVAILGVLGGVFIYFNIKPLKDALDKQEKTIDDLKKEAQSLLAQSVIQTSETIDNFKTSIYDSINETLGNQKENIDLDLENRIQHSEKLLSEKVENISESKDVKLREIILSETNNLLSSLQKEFTSVITLVKEELTKEALSCKSKSVTSDLLIKELDEKVKELQVYKYSKEGMMGAVIISIGLLENAIDDYFKLKKIIHSPLNEEDQETFGWKIKSRLEELIKEIGSLPLEEEYISRIKLQLDKIDNEAIFKPLIVKLRSNLGILEDKLS